MTEKAEIVNNPLTSELMAFMLSDGEGSALKGKIPIYPHPRETRCPVEGCNALFEHMPELGYTCPTRKHYTRPKHYRLYIKGEHIYNDEKGRTLDSYKRANELLHQIQREIADHTYDPTRYIKHEQVRFYTNNLLKRYQDMKLLKTSPSNKSAFKHDIKLASDYFGSRDVRDLRKVHISEFKEHLEKLYPNTKTLKNKLDAFKAFIGWSRSEEIIPIIPPFPDVEVIEKEAESVGQETRIAIFEAVPKEDKPIFACMMLQTVRPGEARALRCKDILIEKKQIHIHATFSKNTYQEKRKGRGARAYKQPIHPEMLEYFTLRKSAGLDEEYVFINHRTGGPYLQDAYLKVWQAVRKALSLPVALRFYEAGKHSSVTLMKSQGASDNTLMRLFGLSNVKTLRKYDHSEEDHSAEMGTLTLKKAEK